FFSSRRRHTRCYRDWSSDVCSSDLDAMNLDIFRQNILELIRRTSAFLPPDVENVINLQRKLEAAGSKADFALKLVAQNIGLAKRSEERRVGKECRSQ